MNHKPLTLGKVFLLLVIVASLVLSVVLSLQSVTGYAVSDSEDTIANMGALISLLVGVFGALIYLAKFR